VKQSHSPHRVIYVEFNHCNGRQTCFSRLIIVTPFIFPIRALINVIIIILFLLWYHIIVIVRERHEDGNFCNQRDRCLRDRTAAVVCDVETAAVVVVEVVQVVVSIRLRRRRHRPPNRWQLPRNPSPARPGPRGPR